MRFARRLRHCRRLTNVGATQQTLVLLPWLNLTARTSVGAMSFDCLANVLAELPADIAATAEAIANGFRDTRGRAVSVSVFWFTDRGATAEIAEEEVDTVRDHILVAMIAAISENRYLSYHKQMNATHFQRVYQNFMPGSETVALVVRRRDGSTTSAGWRIDELIISAPAAAHDRPTPNWKQPFIDALATSIGADDALSRRILDSAVWLFQGSEIEEFESHSEDVVFLVSALEQLCGVSGRYQDRQIADTMINTLGAEWNTEAKRVVRRWSTEAYKKRSELHGGKAEAARWPYWAHALIATEAYCLLTKALLAADGRYVLDERDEVAIEAFPARMACIENETDARRIADCWHRAAGEGAMRRAARRAAEAMRDLWEDSNSGS